jgi:hypothetical protein
MKKVQVYFFCLLFLVFGVAKTFGQQADRKTKDSLFAIELRKKMETGSQAETKKWLDSIISSDTMMHWMTTFEADQWKSLMSLQNQVTEQSSIIKRDNILIGILVSLNVIFIALFFNNRNKQSSR